MSKNDTIDIRVTKYRTDKYDELAHRIDLVLNGEVLSQCFDDFHVLASFMCYRQYTAEVLTCSCGVAGCAGIFYGTEIKVRKNTVEWRDIDSGLPKRFYSFSLANYRATMQKIYDACYTICLEREADKTPESYSPFPESVERFEKFLSYWTHPETIAIRTWRTGIARELTPPLSKPSLIHIETIAEPKYEFNFPAENS